MHMAAMNGFLDCFKKLVALMLNFNVDCIDKTGRTCLHAAACGGSVFQYFVVVNVWVHSYQVSGSTYTVHSSYALSLVIRFQLTDGSLSVFVSESVVYHAGSG